MAARSRNQILHDALIRHQVYLLRSAGTLRRMLVAELAQSEREIKLAIAETDTRSVLRLTRLLGKVRKIRAAAWKSAAALWLDTLIDLAKHEPVMLDKLVNRVAPKALALDKLEAPRKTVTTAVIMGKTPVEWLAAEADSDVDRIETQIRLNAEAEDDSKKFLAGFLAQGLRTQRDIETLSNTVVLGITGLIGAALFDDVANLWQFLAVLDMRTTVLCRSLHGKVYPTGKGPRPPLHWRCRSIRAPLLLGWGDGLSTESYDATLRRQSVSFQDEVLGPRRGKLFRNGLRLDRFVDYNTYHNFTLDELRKRELNAF